MLNALLLCLILGAVLGLVLGIASKVFEVKEDPRAAVVLEKLPGYNCGACGYPGCAGLADALISGDIKHIACKPIKKDAKDDLINYLETTPGPDGTTIQLDK